MVVCSFQFGAPDFKCSPQSAQLAIESGKSHLHSVHTVASYFPWETPKAYRSRIQFDQVAFVIGQKSKAAKTFNKLRTPPGSVSAGARHQDNRVCTARQRFRYTIVVLFARRIEPNRGFEAGCACASIAI